MISAQKQQQQQSFPKASPQNSTTMAQFFVGDQPKQQNIRFQNQMKKSGAFNLYKPINDEPKNVATFSQPQYLNFQDEKKQDSAEELNLSSAFFFSQKNNNINPQQSRVSKPEQNSFRRSPSFKLKQQNVRYVNQSQEQQIEKSSNRNSSQQNTSNQTRTDRFISSTITPSSNNKIAEKQIDRKTRIAALENYIKDITSDDHSNLSSNLSRSQVGGQQQQPKLAPIKASKVKITSEKPGTGYLSETTAYQSNAYPSIIEDSDKNIEEMHFYFVEFQQKCKLWMTKIE